MKPLKIILSALCFLAISQAEAHEPDRELVDGQWLILHANNFEFSCDVVVQEELGKTFNAKVWFDEDSSREMPFRLALSFPEARQVDRFVGVELGIASFKKDECSGHCHEFQLEEGLILRLSATGSQQPRTAQLRIVAHDKRGQLAFEGSCKGNRPGQ